MIEIDAQWDFDDPAASETRFREAMDASAGVARAEYATQIARALGLQGRFDEGHRLLDDLTLPASSRAAVRAELERGRLLNSAGTPDLALPHFIEARDIAYAIGEVGLEIDAIHMLAIVDPDRAEAWAGEGLRRAEESEDQAAKRWIGPLLNNLGWARFDAGRLEEALEAFRASREAYASASKIGAVTIAQWSEARCLREMGDLNEALKIQLDLAATNPEPDPYVFEELVSIYEALDDENSMQQWQAELDRTRGTQP